MQVSGIAGLLRVPSKRHGGSSLSSRTLSQSSDPQTEDNAGSETETPSTIKASLSRKRGQPLQSWVAYQITRQLLHQGLPDRNFCCVQDGLIPALHADPTCPDLLADVQLYEQDSLQVAPSEWSQSKAALRKQKRREHAMQHRPSDADLTASTAVQQTAQGTASSQFADPRQDADAKCSTSGSIEYPASAAKVTSSITQSPAKQLGKRLNSRASSPLGKKKYAEDRGRSGNNGGPQKAPQDQIGAEDLQRRQIAAQEDAEMMIMV